LVPAESGPAGGPDDVAVARRNVRQRIDVEGPDDARIEALEVEDEDVPVETGAGIEDEAADDAAALGVDRPHRWRDATARAERAQVERVDRRDRGADAVELHPRDEAPAHRELDQARALEDLEHQPRVLDVVRGEACGILAIGRLDLPAAVPGAEELPL